jgi:lipoprotein NlpD
VEERLRGIDLGADTYVVRAGDSLESIAFRYKLSPNELAALNPEAGRRLAPGTHIHIRSASAAPESYRTTTAWGSDERTTVPADSRQDQAFTSPVQTPRAVVEPAYQTPPNPSVYTPAVSAVVSDLALLDAGKPYPRPIVQGGEPSSFPREEVIEEEYNAGNGELVSRDLDAPLQSLGSGWVWPTQGQVARGFSPTLEGRHGVDIAGVPGQPVVAVMDGQVAYSGKDPSGSGNLVIVRHENSLLTAYSHCRDLYVAEGDSVRAGDPIGTLGWNSRQESVLRFEVRQDGNSLNPMDFLAAR